MGQNVTPGSCAPWKQQSWAAATLVTAPFQCVDFDGVVWTQETSNGSNDIPRNL